MRVRYTAGALDDLAGIAAYLASRNPASAAKVGAEIRSTIRVVGKHPYSGRALDEATVRNVAVRQYGHLIVYAVDQRQSIVDILGVIDPAQDRSYLER